MTTAVDTQTLRMQTAITFSLSGAKGVMIQGGSTGLRERVAAWRRISTLTARPPAATSTPVASSIAYMGVQGGCRCVVAGPLCCFPYRLPACTAIQMGRGAGKGSVPGPQGMVDGRAGYDAEPVICVLVENTGMGIRLPIDTGNMGFRSIIQIHRSSSRWVGYGLRVPSIRQRSEALYGLSAVAGSRHKSEIITCTPAPMPS